MLGVAFHKYEQIDAALKVNNVGLRKEKCHPNRVSLGELFQQCRENWGITAPGRPTLACAEAGTALYEEVTGRSVCVEPENSTKFSEAPISLAQSTAVRTQLGNAARQRAFSYWDKKAVMLTIEKEILELCR